MQSQSSHKRHSIRPVSINSYDRRNARRIDSRNRRTERFENDLAHAFYLLLDDPELMEAFDDFLVGVSH